MRSSRTRATASQRGSRSQAFGRMSMTIGALAREIELAPARPIRPWPTKLLQYVAEFLNVFLERWECHSFRPCRQNAVDLVHADSGACGTRSCRPIWASPYSFKPLHIGVTHVIARSDRDQQPPGPRATRRRRSAADRQVSHRPGGRVNASRWQAGERLA